MMEEVSDEVVRTRHCDKLWWSGLIEWLVDVTAVLWRQTPQFMYFRGKCWNIDMLQTCFVMSPNNILWFNNERCGGLVDITVSWKINIFWCKVRWGWMLWLRWQRSCPWRPRDETGEDWWPGTSDLIQILIVWFRSIKLSKHQRLGHGNWSANTDTQPMHKYYEYSQNIDPRFSLVARRPVNHSYNPGFWLVDTLNIPQISLWSVSADLC